MSYAPCGSSHDSKKTSSSLVLSLTISGTANYNDSSGPSGHATTFASTTQTKTLTRVPFVPRTWSSAPPGTPAYPAAGGFFLLDPCCCAKCRPSFIFEAAADAFTSSGFSFPYTTTYTGVGHPPTASGSLDIQLRASLSGLTPGISTPGQERNCRSAAEARKGANIILQSEIFRHPDVNIVGSYTFADSAGVSKSGATFGSLQLYPQFSFGPGGYPIGYSFIDLCDPAAAAYNSTVTFSGASSSGSISKDFTLTIAAALALS